MVSITQAVKELTAGSQTPDQGSLITSEGMTTQKAGTPRVDQISPLRTEWNLYLHHPRGTVEHIAGPFDNEEQAESEMNSQVSFGLFPASKGYQWECKEEPEGTVASRHSKSQAEAVLQKSTTRPSSVTASSNKPTKPRQPQADSDGHSGRALSRRLGVGETTLREHKLKPDFPEWSRKKDPENISWEFQKDSSRFYPQPG